MFSLSELNESLDRGFDDFQALVENLRFLRGKVEYDNFLRKLTDALTLQIGPGVVKEYPVDHFLRHVQAYLFTKLRDYQDEQEYRLVAYDAGNYQQALTRFYDTEVP